MIIATSKVLINDWQQFSIKPLNVLQFDPTRRFHIFSDRTRYFFSANGETRTISVSFVRQMASGVPQLRLPSVVNMQIHAITVSCGFALACHPFALHLVSIILYHNIVESAAQHGRCTILVLSENNIPPPLANVFGYRDRS